MILCPIHEFNDCHEPGGTPVGGRFCGRDAFVSLPRANPRDVLAKPYGAQAATVKLAQRRLLRLFAEDGNEHMMVAWKDGSSEYFTSGDQRHVEMPRDGFAAEMRDRKTYFTAHTHPTPTAPSVQDLRMQIRSHTEKQIIFGGDGSWFEITITDFDKAEKAVFTGRQYATYWEKEKKGPFHTAFDRDKKAVSTDATKLTDAWITQQTGWTPAKAPGVDRPDAPDGFRSPDGKEWLPKRGSAQTGIGNLTGPQILAYRRQHFADLSPRIWLKLAEKHKDWLTFRYHKPTGPYATTPTH